MNTGKQTDRKKNRKQPSGGGGASKIIGLLVMLGVIGALVMALVQYHNNTPSPFQNEMFFGPMDNPADAQKATPKTDSKP